MTLRTIGLGKTGDVVEGSSFSGGFGVSYRDANGDNSMCRRFRRVICVILMIVMWITVVPSVTVMSSSVAWADGETSDTGSTDTSSESSGSSDSGSSESSSASSPTFSQDIIDPENVLGSDVTKVTDAIASTKEKTGVTVKLSYLTNFSGAKDADTWAQEALDASNPERNTVLLAAALNDGKLVVAISSNSDDWLNKEAAETLSSAALDPVVSGSTPDWSASALAMMDEIVTLKQTSTRKSDITLGVVAMGSVLVVLIGIVVVIIVLRRRREVDKDVSESSQASKSGETTDNSAMSGEGGRRADRRTSRRASRKGRRAARTSATDRAAYTVDRSQAGESSRAQTSHDGDAQGAASASNDDEARFNAWLASIVPQDTGDVQETSSTTGQAGIHE